MSQEIGSQLERGQDSWWEDPWLTFSLSRDHQIINIHLCLLIYLPACCRYGMNYTLTNPIYAGSRCVYSHVSGSYPDHDHNHTDVVITRRRRGRRPAPTIRLMYIQVRSPPLSGGRIARTWSLKKCQQFTPHAFRPNKYGLQNTGIPPHKHHGTHQVGTTVAPCYRCWMQTGQTTVRSLGLCIGSPARVLCPIIQYAAFLVSSHLQLRILDIQSIALSSCPPIWRWAD